METVQICVNMNILSALNISKDAMYEQFSV